MYEVLSILEKICRKKINEKADGRHFELKSKIIFVFPIPPPVVNCVFPNSIQFNPNTLFIATGKFNISCLK